MRHIGWAVLALGLAAAPLASLSSTHQPASKLWVGSSTNTWPVIVAVPVPGPEFTHPGGGGGGCTRHVP